MHPNDPYHLFASTLLSSPRILCVTGAGLSAPSGLSTWRGTGGLWNNQPLKSLASPEKFSQDPVTVWTFYGERLVAALAAQPNTAHLALAGLAKGCEGWLTVNQNVDGLLEKTEHPGERLKSLHGTLRHVRCTACEYNVWIERADEIPFLEALAGGKTELHTTKLADLPHCPKCAELLRPGVVWFGEELAAGAPDCIDDWVEEEHVDVVISVGTSLEVYPAAEWVETTRALGAVLAVIDTQENHRFADDADWFFHGDVAEILPQILEHLTREQHR